MPASESNMDESTSVVGERQSITVCCRIRPPPLTRLGTTTLTSSSAREAQRCIKHDPQQANVVTAVGGSLTMRGSRPSTARVPPSSTGLELGSMSSLHTQSARQDEYDFSFTHVFPELADQASVYQRVAQPVVEDVLKGYNGSVLVYGQTGSGKTYTVFGPPENDFGPASTSALNKEMRFSSLERFVTLSPLTATVLSNQNSGESFEHREPENTASPIFSQNSQDHCPPPKGTESEEYGNPAQVMTTRDTNTQGIASRALEHIFSATQSSMFESTFEINVSLVEVYMERVRDLLAPPPSTSPRDMSTSTLKVREDVLRNTFFVDGCHNPQVESLEVAMKLVSNGLKRRMTGQTAMNDVSSRSHCMLIVMVKTTHKLNGEVKVGRLALVDLAGSEKVSRTKSLGTQLAEAKLINKSLTTLSMVIAALTSHATHIPYRNSVLTMLLKESLGGNARTAMVVCCAPEMENAAETISTLRFGALAKKMKNRAVVNKKYSIEELEAKLEVARAEIRRLNRLVEKKDSTVGIFNESQANTLDSGSPCRSPPSPPLSSERELRPSPGAIGNQHSCGASLDNSRGVAAGAGAGAAINGGRGSPGAPLRTPSNHPSSLGRDPSMSSFMLESVLTERAQELIESKQWEERIRSLEAELATADENMISLMMEREAYRDQVRCLEEEVQIWEEEYRGVRRSLVKEEAAAKKYRAALIAQESDLFGLLQLLERVWKEVCVSQVLLEEMERRDTTDTGGAVATTSTATTAAAAAAVEEEGEKCRGSGGGGARGFTNRHLANHAPALGDEVLETEANDSINEDSSHLHYRLFDPTLERPRSAGRDILADSADWLSTLSALDSPVGPGAGPAETEEANPLEPPTAAATHPAVDNKTATATATTKNNSMHHNAINHPQNNTSSNTTIGVGQPSSDNNRPVDQAKGAGRSTSTPSPFMNSTPSSLPPQQADALPPPPSSSLSTPGSQPAPLLRLGSRSPGSASGHNPSGSCLQHPQQHHPSTGTTTIATTAATSSAASSQRKPDSASPSQCYSPSLKSNRSQQTPPVSFLEEPDPRAPVAATGSGRTHGAAGGTIPGVSSGGSGLLSRGDPGAPYRLHSNRSTWSVEDIVVSAMQTGREGPSVSYAARSTGNKDSDLSPSASSSLTASALSSPLTSTALQGNPNSTAYDPTYNNNNNNNNRDNNNTDNNNARPASSSRSSGGRGHRKGSLATPKRRSIETQKHTDMLSDAAAAGAVLTEEEGGVAVLLPNGIDDSRFRCRRRSSVQFLEQRVALLQESLEQERRANDSLRLILAGQERWRHHYEQISAARSVVERLRGDAPLLTRLKSFPRDEDSPLEASEHRREILERQTDVYVSHRVV